MPSLPDRKRPRLDLPTRRVAGAFARLASAAIWRTLHPAARERFLETPRPLAVRRLYYEAGDGWRAPLFRIEPAPGAPGEPVVLLHGLGLGPDAFRYGADTLVGALRAAGFAPFLMAHRADREAIPPHPRARRESSFDAVVERDLPAALARVAEDTGFPQVHVIGHGLGGLLAMATAARDPLHLASVTALGAPLDLPKVRSEARTADLALSLLPAHWRLPLSPVARLGLPMVEEGLLPGLADRTPSPRLRGALAYAVEDPPLGLLREVRAWLAAGAPTVCAGTAELAESLRGARVPLLVVTGEDDHLCPPAAGELALERWGHADRTALRAAGLSHVDLLLGGNAHAQVHAPVAAWLDARRRAAWAESAVASVG